MKIGNVECYGVIYKISNKVNGKVYIGLTTLGLKERMYHHVRECKKGTNRRLYNAMRKYGIENFDVGVIDYAFSKKELEIKEILHIKQCHSINKEYGYNMTEGGGSVGKITDEVRNKMSIKAKERMTIEMRNHLSEVLSGEKHPNYGKKLSKETKNKISNSNKGKKVSEETKNKLRHFNLGKKLSAETRNKISKNNWIKNAPKEMNPMYCKTGYKHHSSKCVVQIDEDGYMVREYGSIGDASRTTGFDRKSINNCCLGISKYSNGYVWAYKEEYLNMDKMMIMGKCNVLKKECKIICTTNMERFTSVIEITNKYGIDRSSIYKACKGKTKSAGKINGEPAKWMYYEDYLELQENKIA